MLIDFSLSGIDIYPELETGACTRRPRGASEVFYTSVHYLALACSYCRNQRKQYPQYFQESSSL